MYTLTVELTAFQSVRELQDASLEGAARLGVGKGEAPPRHRVCVVLAVEQLDKRGFIREVYGMEELGVRIQESLNRRHLKMEADFLAEENPPVETLARYVYEMVKKEIPECVAVGISEPPGMWGMDSESASLPPVLFV
jgi:6-pyruvoyl tetrahydropterin synthase